MAPRLALYGLASTLLASLVVMSALTSRPNFYAAAVTIGRSSGALMVLGNFMLFNAIWVGVVLKAVFFGRLRSIEYEHLFERLWLFLTESLLALTIFRDDFSAPFAFMYGLLLFLKCFHWITADRVDYMDQIPPPGPPPLFHVRTSSILLILLLVDLLLVTHSLEAILFDGVSAMVLFASEFMILLASVGGTLARYIVGLVDLRRARGRADAPSWEEKSMWLFYIDLAVDFVKLLTYLSFFTVILLHYGLPLHILRDVYMTLRSFLSRVSDLIRYRRATRDMDALYPNASSEEMDRLGDKTCIICREEMVVQGSGEDAAADAAEAGPNETPKRLACGHVFHFHCLRSWLERQQSCPTCRRDVLTAAAPTLRARPGVPPPPAPGAVPQANGNARPQVPPNPLQAIYDQYFRQPGAAAALQGPRPAPAAMLTPAPSPAANGVARPTAAEAARPQTEAEILQRGIWGGPVTPGMFAAAPLGAARWRRNVVSSGAAPPPSRPALPNLATVPPPTRPRTHTLRPASSGSSVEAISSSSTGNKTESPAGAAPKSGTTTPWSSNPPEIFSSTGTSREGGTEDSDSAKVGKEESETSARRAAAEAAMRRMGLGWVGGGTSGASTPRKAPADEGSSTALPVLDTPDIPTELGQTGMKAKGKGKAGHPMDEVPRHVPYLTSLAPPGREPPLPWADGGYPASADGAAAALEQRLRVLRDVDEAVWGLVGELTRVRSSWAAEDEGRRGAAGRAGSRESGSEKGVASDV